MTPLPRFTGLLLGLALAGTAPAQDLSSWKDQASGLLGKSPGSSGASLLDGLGSGTFRPASARNVAGVLGYCQQQGYLKSGTEQIKDQLLGKLGGQPQLAQDQGYQQGLGGLLQGSGGRQFDLASLKGRIGEAVCRKLGEKAAASFLGG